jgi:hypothetical protein
MYCQSETDTDRTSLYLERGSYPPVPSLACEQEREDRTSSLQETMTPIRGTRTRRTKRRQGTMQAVRRAVPSEATCSPVMRIMRRATRSTSWKPSPKHRYCEVWRLRRGNRAWHAWREDDRNLRGPVGSAQAVGLTTTKEEGRWPMGSRTRS